MAATATSVDTELDRSLDAALRCIDAGDDEGVRSALERIETLAEHAGDRRGQGIFFTAPDVTHYVVGVTLAGALAELVGNAHLVAAVDDAITDGSCPLTPLREWGGACARSAGALRRAVERVVVFDPTCGGGAFLLEAVRALAGIAGEVGARLVPEHITGCDLRAEAVRACRHALTIELVRCGVRLADAHAAVTRSVWQADATAAIEPPHVPHVVVGNPPYVRERPAPIVAGLHSERCANLAAWVVERALDTAPAGARTGFVLPVSTICTDAFQPLRDLWNERFASAWVSSYDTVPCSLFTGVVQRLSIVLGTVGDGAEPVCRWHTTGYRRWRAHERATLFSSLAYTPASPHGVRGSLAKIGTAVERDLLDRLFVHPPASRWLASRAARDAGAIWYKRRWSYFLLFVDFVPPIFDARGKLREPTEFKRLDIASDLDPRVLLAIYNSSLFYWYFTVFGDNRNVNRRELGCFPVPDLDDRTQRALADLADELMHSLRASSELRTCTYRSIGTIRNTYFRQASTRPVLDRIDACLARAYGLDAQQARFVVEFEAGYRGGGGGEAATSAGGSAR